MGKVAHSKVNIGNASFELIIRSEYLGTKSTSEPRLHCHPTYEVHCIEKGTIKYRFDNSLKVVSGPALIIFPPKFYHKIENASGDCVYYAFEFYTYMNGVGNSFRKFSNLLSNVISPEVLEVEFQSVDIIIDYKPYPEELEFAVFAQMGQIILTMFNALMNKYPQKEIDISARKSNVQKELTVAQIMSYMEKNAFRPLTLSDISKEFNFSERQIERMFNEVMHDSFFSLLNKYRIRIATLKISQGETNLSKVAEECGFSNYVTFWNRFTKLNGMTPSEYQKRNNRNI